MNEFMRMAALEAEIGSKAGDGGPFGCVVCDSEGNVVSRAHNTVFVDCDPTCHAEINAIRKACSKLGTYDLTGCTIYSSCEPCPMCLAAIIWANITEVFHGCTREDAASFGFRDADVDRSISGEVSVIDVKHVECSACVEVIERYAQANGVQY